MSENITVTFRLPDYISTGETFTVECEVHNPLDDEVNVYIWFLRDETQISDVIQLTIPPGENRTAYTSITATTAPFNFKAKAEAYMDNVLIAEGEAYIVIEGKPAINIPILIGMGSILWGASHEYR